MFWTVPSFIMKLAITFGCIKYDLGPTGATCKGVLQLEANIIDVKHIYPRTRTRVFGILFFRLETLFRYIFFHINKSYFQLEDALASGSIDVLT